MAYRTHHCNELTLADEGQPVILSGWVQKIRNHGGLMFVDLRDHYGITQIVIDPTSPAGKALEGVRIESVIQVGGLVHVRPAGTTNPNLATGDIEVKAFDIKVLSRAQEIPVPVAEFDANYPEHLRLKYRYIDLRRAELHRNIVLRSRVIDHLRMCMKAQGFMEFQTPILTASSPEGARDFLVPSRLHPGSYYALPQAPQQFKQLLMVSGFDRYFQIAPCFRDESARGDRSPGEFYQLDLEMSFVDQDDVFEVTETVISQTFAAFSGNKTVGKPPFIRIPYRESIRRFGSDKPDLRNPLEFKDVSDFFRGGPVPFFTGILETPGNEVWAIPMFNVATGALTREADKLAKEEGLSGVAGLFQKLDANGMFDGYGGIGKFLTDEQIYNLKAVEMSVNAEDGLLFIAGNPAEFYKFAGKLRDWLATKHDHIPGFIDENEFKFCWIVDFPMYELDAEGKVAFSHNPFSMPQGGMEALETQDPLDILAYQYDLVCNGVELSSGAIRNHEPETMLKAFEIAGYDSATVEDKFGGMLNAFRYGAPPHGGIAPGVDRIVMLLAGATNIKDVIAFPLDSQGRDLMMNAPSPVTPEQLKELRIKNI